MSGRSRGICDITLPLTADSLRRRGSPPCVLDARSGTLGVRRSAPRPVDMRVLAKTTFRSTLEKNCSGRPLPEYWDASWCSPNGESHTKGRTGDHQILQVGRSEGAMIGAVLVAIDSNIVDLVEIACQSSAYRDAMEAMESPPPFRGLHPQKEVEVFACYWLLAMAPAWGSTLLTFSDLLYDELAHAPRADSLLRFASDVFAREWQEQEVPRARFVEKTEPLWVDLARPQAW